MLKFKLDTLDGIDEPLKALYAKGEDGRFTLQVDESGAKSALQKERERADAAERALKEREKAEADAKTAAERAQLEAKGEYEKLKASIEAEKAKVQKERDEAHTSLKSYIARAEATAAVARAKGVPELVLPHVMDKVEVVSDGADHKVLVKGGGTLDELMESLRTNPTFARAFDAAGHSGGGTNPGGGTRGGGGKQTMSRSAFEQLPAQARMEAMKAGSIEVTD